MATSGYRYRRMLKAFTARTTLFRVIKWIVPVGIATALAIRMTLAAVAFPESCAPNPTGAGHNQREAIFRAECHLDSKAEAALLSVIPRFWTPDVDLSGAFRERVRLHVQEQSMRGPRFKEVLDRFDTYLIVYSGYRRWSDGGRVISIFGFCDDIYLGGPNPRTVAMLETINYSFTDGGTCAMFLEYDVEKNSFGELFTGGEA